MAFSKQPRSIGSVVLQAGSRNADRITGYGGEAWFSGDGDDELTGVRETRGRWTLAVFLSGGRGNDRYIVKPGSFSIISDQGGGRDTVDLSAMDEFSTYFVKLNRGVIGITDGTTTVAIHSPFKGKNTAIEEVIFGGRSWSAKQLYDYGVRQGASLGTSTFSSLESGGNLNFSILGLDSSDRGIASIISAAAYNSTIIT